MTDNTIKECHRLLVSLKRTVEELLCMPGSQVWNAYGGLQRVTTNVYDIFTHELKCSSPQNPKDRADCLWNLIRGLKYLDPVLGPNIDKISRDTSISNKSRSWVERSLTSFTMTNQLGVFLAAPAYMAQFYSDRAYLRQPAYTAALLTCLQAIESNRAAILADIDPYLLSTKSYENPVSNNSDPAPEPIKGPLSSVESPDVTTPTSPVVVRRKCARAISLRRTHVRSASLPRNLFSEVFEDAMVRRPKDPLAPPLPLCSTPGTPAVCQYTAVPDNISTSSEESARESLMQVLYQCDQSEPEFSSPRELLKLCLGSASLLCNMAMVPSKASPTSPNKYSANLVHVSSFKLQTPVLRLKNRKQRKEKAEKPVLNRAISAEVLNRLLNDEKTPQLLQRRHSEEVNQPNGLETSLLNECCSCKEQEVSGQSLSCEQCNSNSSTKDAQNNEGSTQNQTSSLSLPCYDVDRITTQPELLSIHTSLPSTPMDSLSFASSIVTNTDSNQHATSPVVTSEDIATPRVISNAPWVIPDTPIAPRIIPDTPLAGGVGSEDAGGKRHNSTHHRSRSDFGVVTSPAVSTTPARASGRQQSHSNHNNSNRSSSVSNLQRQAGSPVGSYLPGSASFFHQPQQGESLIGFLSSHDFRTAADLDKENAHLSICETLIAALEQMKVSHVLAPPSGREDEAIEGDSDEEIQQLKQRIRIRRRERLTEKARGLHAFPDSWTETVTSSTASHEHDSFQSTSDSQGELYSSEEEVHDTSIQDADKEGTGIGGDLASLRASGLSLSLASLYSDAELAKSNSKISAHTQTSQMSTSTAGSRSATACGGLGSILPDGTLLFTAPSPSAAPPPNLSAEGVAIALLQRFSETQLPKASELEWLVSEQDAPQQLLPLPDSIPISPDDNENADLLTSAKRTRLRGNLEWAPPRAQIIFNLHPAPVRKVQLAAQNHRCAGCGTRVQQAYQKRYRYCEYLGKYFCPCCHSNEVATIPARVLQRWDFTKYPVSNFARDLLARIENEPLFSIQDLNPGLYKKVRALEQIRDLRRRLCHLVAFLRTCRHCTQLRQLLDGEPQHWTVDPHLYTIQELSSVKRELLLPRIRALVSEATQHVAGCQLCQAKGFICELCKNSDTIFPFQLDRVVQCDFCSTCFHVKCFQPDKCPKCARIELRRMRVNEDIEQEDEELYQS